MPYGGVALRRAGNATASVGQKAGRVFERFSESARRVLFFARYELSTLGGRTIEPGHILLGLLRELPEHVVAIFEKWNIPVQDVRQEVEAQAGTGDRIATSVEVPFSESARRVLTFATEEADRLLDDPIEPHHMLLGIIRESDLVAAASLTKYGVTLEGAREHLMQSRTRDSRSGETIAQLESRAAARRELASTHIQRIMALVRDLEQSDRNSTDAHDIVARIDDELMLLGELWK